MNYLLDTHLIIWALLDKADKLRKARDIIADKRNRKFYSLASIWEITIKHRLHPDEFPSGEAVLGFCQMSGLIKLPIQENHILALDRLERDSDAPPHRDPFDRLLLAQAQSEEMALLTHDKNLQYYSTVDVQLV
ncbi:MAG: type II toxin-antitoxin system VapC family toxin [Selenomonadaceae bacterium]|nr:type II toxin-antitoxin system VapC family toxin [Selenomonadaceae bacterium]